MQGEFGMMRVGLLLVGLLCLGRAGAETPPLEYRYLDGWATTKRWGPAECEIAISPQKAWEQPVVRMHIPVDYTTGEKKHPIGWPRMYLNLTKDEQVVESYDLLEFQIFTESSRSTLPKEPLNFQIHDKQGHKKNIWLTQCTIGQWCTVQVRVADLSFAEVVTRIGFNISEANYDHKDSVTFHIGGFRLARYTVPYITELRVNSKAIFSDSSVLPIELMVAGSKEKLAGGIPLQLSCGGEVLLERQIAVARGKQSVVVPLDKIKLKVGSGKVTLFAAQPSLRKEVEFLVVNSPWQ